MGVARQIAQHLLGPGERRLAVDDPLDVAAAGQMKRLNVLLVGEPGMGRRRTSTRRRRCASHEHRQQHAPEQARQHLDVHEEVAACTATHRVPSSERPPPGTIMCTCG